MTRITTDLHNALVKISDHGFKDICDTHLRKLELMGFITPEFGDVWKITDEGFGYLQEHRMQEIKPASPFGSMFNRQHS